MKTTLKEKANGSLSTFLDLGFLVAHVALHIPCLLHVSKVLDGTVVDEANKAQEMDVP